MDLSLNAVADFLRTLWSQATEIWLDGGWAMIPIAGIALVMFGVGMQLQLEFAAKGFLRLSEKTWRRWIQRPEERRGAVGDLLDAATGARTVAETAQLFEQLRTAETRPLARDLRVMKICVSAAPLVGLLGTVTGMLSTFGALASGAGGEQTMALVASGISEALITTETGLVIALPGLFFQYQLQRKFERYKAFLAHVETVCAQALYRSLQGAGASPAARPAV
jgi:biopolymer transport protein ExbB